MYSWLSFSVYACLCVFVLALLSFNEPTKSDCQLSEIPVLKPSLDFPRGNAKRL